MFDKFCFWLSRIDKKSNDIRSDDFEGQVSVLLDQSIFRDLLLQPSLLSESVVIPLSIFRRFFTIYTDIRNLPFKHWYFRTAYLEGFSWGKILSVACYYFPRESNRIKSDVSDPDVRHREKTTLCTMIATIRRDNKDTFFLAFKITRFYTVKFLLVEIIKHKVYQT